MLVEDRTMSVSEFHMLRMCISAPLGNLRELISRFKFYHFSLLVVIIYSSLNYILYRMVEIFLSIDDIKKTEAQIKKLEKQKAILAKKIRLETNKLNAKKRKARTKRLIEKGAVLEKLQAENAENILPEQTVDWLKNNINSEALKDLKNQNAEVKKLKKQVQELQEAKEKLDFFMANCSKWTFTLEDGSKETVTERVINLWNDKCS